MHRNLIIKPLSADNSQQLADWIETEGWNPGIQDVDTLLRAAHAGWLGIWKGEQLAGMASVFNHSYKFAFFGLYIIQPEFRQKEFRQLELGITLNRHRLQMAGYRNIGLDGVMEQYDNYRHIGFRLAHRTPRYMFTQIVPKPQPNAICDLKEITLIELLDYERNNQLFPCRRKTYLKAWLTQTDATGFCYRINQEIMGYGMIRPCMEGFKIGPLFANTPDIAQDLLLALLSTTNGQKTYCDIPENNEQALLLAEQLGGTLSGFCSARMYRGFQPELQLQKIYGITSIEAG
ncbi:hypothetical protein EOPP23_12150 [Endozoicomonas sp. OPT23]|uniref:hypothetical protein n=1 Tax=Endozoicomonas sp. OPT23 TaxID=2072845 RepID=UPI00129A5E8D|nr:hypothetical protein [Endozoicomonas sp. OPT23]MRI33739.1 hypothetical protein [Endozoicomonas sp. OPT23]